MDRREVNVAAQTILEVQSRPDPFALPPELWIATLDKLRISVDDSLSLIGFHVPDTRTLKNLSLTSHHFHDLSLPFLFERILLSGRHSHFNRTQRILSILATRPERSHWVHELGLEKWDFSMTAQEELTRNIWSALQTFPSLRAVRLDAVTTTVELLDHLRTLRHFYFLSLRGCGFDTRSSSQVSSVGPPSITSLVVRGPLADSMSIPTLFMNDRLRYVCHGASFAPQIFGRVADVPFLSLTKYHMIRPTLSDIHMFFTVAPNLPNLTALRIEQKSSKIATDEIDTTPIPSAVLPILEDVAAPLWALAKVVPGHPIRRVKVHGLGEVVTAHDCKMFKQLSLGSTKVSILILESSAWVHLKFGDIGELFPEVEELTFTLRKPTSLPVEVRNFR